MRDPRPAPARPAPVSLALLRLARAAALGALAAVAVAGAGRLAVPAAHAQAASLYVVQPGDTLFKIASANGLSVARLKELNGLPDDVIRVGQTLRLSTRVPMPAPPAPANPTPAEAPAEPERRPGAPWPLEPGDAPASEPSRPLVPARLEAAPTEQAPAGPAATHTVRAGETLFAIALRYDTTVEALRRLNGIQGDRIEIGQRLAVQPGASGGAGGGAARPARYDAQRTTVPADMVHFVRPGDTLYGIAARYGFGVRELVGANPGLSTAPLAPGLPIYFPRPANLEAVRTGTMRPPDESGLALVYPDALAGRPTASGEPYDPEAFVGSHRTLPFGSVMLVTNPTSGRSTFVRVVDRGPVSQGYLVELSAAAADVLGLDPNAARPIEVRSLD